MLTRRALCFLQPLTCLLLFLEIPDIGTFPYPRLSEVFVYACTCYLCLGEIERGGEGGEGDTCTSIGNASYCTNVNYIACCITYVESLFITRLKFFQGHSTFAGLNVPSKIPDVLSLLNAI